jgi:cyclopropane fatty-acyl-phospholipid synthase-like methyltransferase
MHEYKDDFYAFLSSFAIRSAQRVVPIVQAATGAATIADFGCGEGAWLSVWKQAGLRVQGVDGDYVNRHRLLIDASEFLAADLSQHVNLGRRFDLVQSLETAEHLLEDYAATFVSTLTAHADMVLFSAAVPGQGGEHHVNERNPEFWRALFREQDFRPVDFVRPLIRNDEQVQRWYRYNTLLYVRRGSLEKLSPEAQKHALADDTPIANTWPLRDRLQQAVIRCLPVPVVDKLARWRAASYAK